jgi:hypothetical protein
VASCIAAVWGSIFLFKDAIKKGTRWYDRIIRFLGALLMAGLAAGIVYLWNTGKLSK